MNTCVVFRFFFVNDTSFVGDLAYPTSIPGLIGLFLRSHSITAASPSYSPTSSPTCKFNTSVTRVFPRRAARFRRDCFSRVRECSSLLVHTRFASCRTLRLSSQCRRRWRGRCRPPPPVRAKELNGSVHYFSLLLLCAFVFVLNIQFLGFRRSSTQAFRC